MADLTKLSNEFDEKKLRCVAIIETPKHRRSKFSYDPESNLFTLKSSLPEGMLFPFDFGFVPSTLGEDGDPLDVLVLMDEPVHVGCLLRVQLVGVIEAEQTERNGARVRNDRLLAVAVDGYQQQKLDSLRQLPKSLLEHITHFFASYNELRGKKFKLKAFRGPKRAARLVAAGIKAFTHHERAAS